MDTQFTMSINKETRGETWDKFQKMAAEQDRSVSYLLNKLIRLAVEQPEILKTRKKLKT